MTEQSKKGTNGTVKETRATKTRRVFAEERELRCDLDDAERLDLHNKSHGCRMEAMEFQAEREAESKRLKAAVEEREKQAMEFGRIAVQGYETRTVKCERVIDHRSKKTRIRRMDTGKVIEERAVTPEEAQMFLDQAKQKPEKPESPDAKQTADAEPAESTPDANDEFTEKAIESAQASPEGMARFAYCGADGLPVFVSEAGTSKDEFVVLKQRGSGNGYTRVTAIPISPSFEQAQKALDEFASAKGLNTCCRECGNAEPRHWGASDLCGECAFALEGAESYDKAANG